MRIVVQRVLSAAVSVNQQTIGSIQHGLLVLAGFEVTDTQEDFEWICKKLINLRIFNDATGQMNLSCADTNGQILVVSQFTLLASTQKGNRPSYLKAAPPEQAKQLYSRFLTTLSSNYSRQIETGEFGANMQVRLVNDGPVTIIIDSKNRA
jgi:D-tyrosyl-tRNA(Tyr) deacylase